MKDSSTAELGGGAAGATENSLVEGGASYLCFINTPQRKERPPDSTTSGSCRQAWKAGPTSEVPQTNQIPAISNACSRQSRGLGGRSSANFRGSL